MSKNFNRTKTKFCTTNKDYNMIMKNYDLYCYICVRRAGRYSASCHPSAYNLGYFDRIRKSWKYNSNRRKQYREKINV